MGGTSANDVLLYVPNLIGYMRVIFTVGSLVLMIFDSNQWALAMCLYLMSFVGDLFDGMAARKLNQSSTFGGLLDMITDRCSTAGLLFVLSGEYTDSTYYPHLRLLFVLLILLDMSSHWCQVYSTSALPNAAHHKSAEGNEGRFFLVRWYYGFYPFFGYCCVGAEATYILLYVLANVSESSDIYPYCQNALYAVIPACAVKQLVNVVQLCSACKAIAEHDANLKNQ
mmetsp:Transcript_11394/g.15784  ORF Transcript_11394/g.15784 Transcript_11394/m.15784 type:complete len:226 (-) Transcript_11394:74-751(-)